MKGRFPFEPFLWLSFQRMQTLMNLRSVNYLTRISKNKKSWAGICGKLKMLENFSILWKCFPVSYQKFSENQSNAKRLKIGTSLRSFFNSVCCVISYRFKSKIETLFCIFDLFYQLQIVATKIIFFFNFVKLPSAGKFAILYQAREIVCKSSQDCFCFLDSKEYSSLLQQKIGSQYCNQNHVFSSKLNCFG